MATKSVALCCDGTMNAPDSSGGSRPTHCRTLAHYVVVACVVAGTLLGCDGEEPDDVDQPVVALTPSTLNLSVGQSAVLVGTVMNHVGTLGFTSSNPGVVQIVSQTDFTVTIRAVGEGSAVIRAFILGDDRYAAASAIVVSPASGGTLPTGTRAAPQTQPEGLQILSPGASGSTAFGPWADRYVAAIGGSTGWTALDLITNEVLHQPVGLVGPFFGVAAASQDPPGASSTAGFVAFGGGGYAVQNVIDGSFTATQIGFGTTYDASLAGGRKITDVIPFVQPASGVGFVQFDGTANAYFQTSENVPAPPTGELVSAYLHDGSGQAATGAAPILLLTRAVESIVWLNRRDGSASSNVLTLGLDARKLRCIEVSGGGALCAVTLFGHNEVAVFTWDGANAPVFVGNVDAPGQPVDLDLRLLDNGNVALLTTGFGTGALTEVELSQAGAQVSHEVGSVPAGCTGAGHAVYIEDEAGLKIVGTCYSSNQYYITESRF